LARLYTQKEIQKALQELRIDPVDGNVSTKEAARILTWRATSEFGVPHIYPDAAVRSRVKGGHLTPATPGWANLYRVEDIFRLTLYPKRGTKTNSSEEAIQKIK
jgi:hypothetical protein